MADAGWPGGTKPGPGGRVAGGTCPTCGHAYAPGARFCDGCGNPVAPTIDPAGDGAAPQAPPDELFDTLRSATLGEYDLYGLLGRGGMASVYLALDLALNRQVAIKVISTREMHSDDGAARFLREAQTAAHLSHPNIIPIHSVKRTPELLYFVMRFVEGSPLDAVIKEAGTLPVRMARAILSQVATALQFAHRKGVIHRDIKPANIMIDEDGNSIVTDFGIAKVESGTNLTMTGAVMGTPYYMSPEQISGHQISGAADQYSLGVVAYEMLTGRPPFMGDSVMTLMKAHLWDPPQPLHELRPELPVHLANTVMRMLSKEPAERWPDLSEFVRALDAKHLPEDDALRSQIIDLTKTNASKRPRISVPLSPMPPVRRPRPAAEAPPPPPAADPLTTARKEVERLEAEDRKRLEADRMATERIDAAPLAKAVAASAPTAQLSAYESVGGTAPRQAPPGAVPAIARKSPAPGGRRRLVLAGLGVAGVAIAAGGLWFARANSNSQRTAAPPPLAADSAQPAATDSTVAPTNAEARVTTSLPTAPPQTPAPEPARTKLAAAPPNAADVKATVAKAPDPKAPDPKATVAKAPDAKTPDSKQVTAPAPVVPKPSAVKAETASKVAAPPSAAPQKVASSDAGAKLPATAPVGPSAADLAAAKALACSNPATASTLLTTAFAGDAAAKFSALYQPRDGGDGKAKASFIDMLKGARGATASVRTERNEPTVDGCHWLMAVDLKWVNAFGQPRQKSVQLRVQLDGSGGAARIAQVFGATGL